MASVADPSTALHGDALDAYLDHVETIFDSDDDEAQPLEWRLVLIGDRYKAIDLCRDKRQNVSLTTLRQRFIHSVQGHHEAGALLTRTSSVM